MRGQFSKMVLGYMRNETQKVRRSSVGPSRQHEIIGFSLSAIILISVIYCLCTSYMSNDDGGDMVSRELRNSLCEIGTDDLTEKCPEPASHPALVIPYFIGTFYLFIAIAIVCDEFFVPALEEIAAEWGLSDDVAGATLMAAGGSAPELAASMIGTFTGSSVGFGTIVGSAVFNVLFVIACCVLFTPQEYAPLELTGWPLGRDCSYYCLCLLMIAIFFGAVSPGKIEGWEAAILFCLYIGYVTLMANNEYIYAKLNGVKVATEIQDDKSDDGLSVKTVPEKLTSPTRFRAGFYHLISQEGHIFDTAGVSIVSKIKGDVRQVFDQLDKDQNGTLDSNEIKELLEMLADDKVVTDQMVDDLMKEVDRDHDGAIDFAEFTVWYVKSEQRLKTEEMKIFHHFDHGHKGSITLDKLGPMLKKMHVHYTAEQLEGATKHFSNSAQTSIEEAQGKLDDNVQLIGEVDKLSDNTADKDFAKVDIDPHGVSITYEEFSHWFEHSSFWEELQHDADCAGDSAEGIWGDLLDFPRPNAQLNFIYIFMAPITWTLGLTAGIRDVRVPGNEGWCYFEFLMSIIWIGAYSYLLVSWVSTIGATLGIPVYIMGLTILAAGTSVPDLLSSVVVAKAGKGDMAVSSSIGSNIFDVTVGLPVPWMLFAIIYDCPITVGADGVVVSIIVLLGMVLFVILSIMLCNWKMSFNLGMIMLVMYVLFVAQDVIRVYATSGDVGC